ncbi:FkbM family methyltransferase [Pseudoalteromonas sp. MMG013]|uniref:FkbM family methyltransferase n=1 Tax=Pseudoalteromonas sp. MMG013 TaxID=2822687 RepID=UPI001B36C19C|nr:FkbM family methyltransferase [Pseudoalteromonas sp. MMG013]MBQ4861991.1 FkbM family methyltransferase [Pseudoalteromonas sp. MMG013]
MVKINDKYEMDEILIYERSLPIYEVAVEDSKVQFAIPTHHAWGRAEYCLSAEPQTIQWIKELKEDDILWDVGANVGTYTLLAAKLTGAKCISFEPESGNYYLLNKNISLNKLGCKITAYNLAIAEHIGFTSLYLNWETPGASMNAVDKPINIYDSNDPDGRKEFEPAFRQGIAVTTIDDLVYNQHFSPPSFLKIDVDGVEPAILQGAMKLLASGKCRSCLIEVSKFEDDHLNMLNTMKKLGFTARDPKAVNVIFDFTGK